MTTPNNTTQTKPSTEGPPKLQVDLLNVLAHECRTPLTSIRGFAETLQRFEGRIASDQRLEMLEMIQQQADRLIRLTHNLTTMARQGQALSASLLPRPLPLAPLLQRCVRTHHMKHDTPEPLKALHYQSLIEETHEMAWIHADPDALENIFWNLLENGIKYGHANYPIYSSLVAHQSTRDESPPTLVWQMANISASLYSEEALVKIQMPFSRMDDPLTRSQEGLGLGLYIMHQLTEAMGATLRLHSRCLSDYKSTRIPEEVLPPQWRELPESSAIFWVTITFPCFKTKKTS